MKLWAPELEEFEIRDAHQGIRLYARSASSTIPSLSGVLAMCNLAQLSRRQEEAKDRELAEAGTWSPEDEARAKEVGVEVLSGWREQHPREDLKPRQGIPEPKRPTRKPETEADIEQRRQMAREMREAELKRQEQEQGEGESEDANTDDVEEGQARWPRW